MTKVEVTLSQVHYWPLNLFSLQKYIVTLIRRHILKASLSHFGNWCVVISTLFIRQLKVALSYISTFQSRLGNKLWQILWCTGSIPWNIWLARFGCERRFISILIKTKVEVMFSKLQALLFNHLLGLKLPLKVVFNHSIFRGTLINYWISAIYYIITWLIIFWRSHFHLSNLIYRLKVMLGTVSGCIEVRNRSLSSKSEMSFSQLLFGLKSLLWFL